MQDKRTRGNARGGGNTMMRRYALWGLLALGGSTLAGCEKDAP